MPGQHLFRVEAYHVRTRSYAAGAQAYMELETPVHQGTRKNQGPSRCWNDHGVNSCSLIINSEEY